LNKNDFHDFQKNNKFENNMKLILWYFDHGKNDLKVVILRRNIENTKKICSLEGTLRIINIFCSMHTA